MNSNQTSLRTNNIRLICPKPGLIMTLFIRVQQLNYGWSLLLGDADIYLLSHPSQDKAQSQSTTTDAHHYHHHRPI